MGAANREKPVAECKNAGVDLQMQGDPIAGQGAQDRKVYCATQEGERRSGRDGCAYISGSRLAAGKLDVQVRFARALRIRKRPVLVLLQTGPVFGMPFVGLARWFYFVRWKALFSRLGANDLQCFALHTYVRRFRRSCSNNFFRIG